MPTRRKPTPPKPSSLAREMGILVRQARVQAGLTQAELATRVKRRQASISDIENGRMEIDASTLVGLANTLQRPISYFFPSWILQALQPESLTPEEQSLLVFTQKLGKEDLKRIIIQVRALTEAQKREYYDWLDEEENRHK